MSTTIAHLDDFPEAPLRTGQDKIALRERTPLSVERPAPENAGPGRSRRNWKMVALAVVGAVSAATAGIAYLRHAAKFEETDNAFVEADVHPVSGRVTGDVLEVLVEDYQTVVKGQPLLRLDPRDLQVKLQTAKAGFAQASAQVPQAVAVVAQSKAALNQALAQIASSEAQLEKARLDYERAANLNRGDKRVISQADFDAARASFDSARGNASAADAGREAASAAVRTAEAGVEAAKAGLDRARAAVEDAELQLSYTMVLAPEDGRIAKKTVETGQHVQPGQALMAVVSPEHWVVANFKENQLSDMRAHQPVDITVDAIRGRHFRGHVDSIAPGTGAEFSLLPPDNATGNFTKIVQRVPVKILLDAADAGEFGSRMAPGLSVTATVQVKE